MGSDQEAPATAAVIVGFMFLAIILAFIALVAYRRRRLQQATVVPAWEANERGQAVTCQALEEVLMTETFLPENQEVEEVKNEVISLNEKENHQ
jgi:hypothetical protein